jgi:hypothetical protein
VPPASTGSNAWSNPVGHDSSATTLKNRCARRAKRSYTPRHGELALPALRHAPAGGVPVLGLFAILDELRDVLAFPAQRRRCAGHLRS